MIAEICPAVYDADGKRVGSPTTKKRKQLFASTFPPGRYVSQPLSKQCSTIGEMRKFLSQCKYVSDQEQFGRRDYWMPPEEFENRKQGDCDDFALWTWRQLLGMGFKARYVVGRAGKHGDGHAWVTIEKDGKHFVVEPLAWYVGETLPRLSVVRYEPAGSFEWDGNRLRDFVHNKPKTTLSVLELLVLVGEWLSFWVEFWLRFVLRFCLLPFFVLKKFLKRRFSSARADKRWPGWTNR